MSFAKKCVPLRKNVSEVYEKVLLINLRRRCRHFFYLNLKEKERQWIEKNEDESDNDVIFFRKDKKHNNSEGQKNLKKNPQRGRINRYPTY